MDTKHGGSPTLGLVPAGLGNEKPVAPGSMILEPEVAKDNRNAKDRALQFERRRLALANTPALLEGLDPRCVAEIADPINDAALALADSLLKKTGGHV